MEVLGACLNTLETPWTEEYFPRAAAPVWCQQSGAEPVSGRRYPRIVIRNATVIEGNGTPAAGPKDIVIDRNLIRDIVPLDAVSAGRDQKGRPQGDTVINHAGKYVMPGLINAHAHVHDERGGIPMPVEYCLKLWLACGITTVRDVGSDTPKTLNLRKQSAGGEIAAPRLFVYPFFNRLPNPRNAVEARARVQEYEGAGGGWHQGPGSLPGCSGGSRR